MRSFQGLRLYRLAAGFDQAELAKRVGVSRQLIAKLETNRVAPRLDLARRLARLLDADVDTLFPAVGGRRQEVA